MKGIPISDYIFFGLGYRYVQDVGEGFRVHGSDLILENLERVLDCLDDFELPVTKRAASDLVEIYERLKAASEDYILTSEDADAINSELERLQQTLRAETGGNIAYVVTDKRIDIKKLLEKPEALFRPDVFNRLSSIAQYDFSEAGKCIAFERPTAAAFHLLRGTEEVLRMFYYAQVKRNRITNLMWGPVTQALRNRRTPPPPELLQNLDNIRVSFRNPTQHPEKIYDIQEVQDLFSLCIDVVNRMVALIT